MFNMVFESVLFKKLLEVLVGIKSILMFFFILMFGYYDLCKLLILFVEVSFKGLGVVFL